MEVFRHDVITVHYPAEFAPYAQASALIVDAGFDVFVEKFRHAMRRPVLLSIEMDWCNSLGVHTERASIEMNWRIRSKMDFAPPGKGAPYNVYGLLHELGHVAMPLPREAPLHLKEGIADYFGYTLILSVWNRLGRNAWPQPHDYLKAERDRRGDWLSGSDKGRDTVRGIAWTFWETEAEFGPGHIGRILNDYNARTPSMDRFFSIVASVTGKRLDEQATSDGEHVPGGIETGPGGYRQVFGRNYGGKTSGSAKKPDDRCVLDM